jgi:hypothetical protein
MTRREPKTGDSRYKTWAFNRDAALPPELRGMRRVPVAVKDDGFNIEARRLSVDQTSEGAPPTFIVEIWSSDNEGNRTERYRLHCAWCGERADTRDCRNWRQRYLHTGSPLIPSQWYCCAECRRNGHKARKW